MNSGGNTGPGCVVSVLVSCDRLISPGYGKGIGNRPFSLFPVETLIENFATCGLRFAANRLASHLESVCNRANWSTIRAKFKSRSSYDTARLLSTRFQTAAPFLPPLDGKHRGDGWKAGNNPCGRNTRSPNSNVILPYLFIFIPFYPCSFLFSFLAEFDTGFCSLKRERNFAVHGDCFVALDEYSSITFATIIFLHFRRLLS